MKEERFRVLLLDDATGAVKEELFYRSFKEICDAYKLPYHVVRQLYRYSGLPPESVTLTRPRDLMRHLSKRMRIERLPFELVDKLK